MSPYPIQNSNLYSTAIPATWNTATTSYARPTSTANTAYNNLYSSPYTSSISMTPPAPTVQQDYWSPRPSLNSSIPAATTNAVSSSFQTARSATFNPALETSAQTTPAVPATLKTSLDSSPPNGVGPSNALTPEQVQSKAAVLKIGDKLLTDYPQLLSYVTAQDISRLDAAKNSPEKEKLVLLNILNRNRYGIMRPLAQVMKQQNWHAPTCLDNKFTRWLFNKTVLPFTPSYVKEFAQVYNDTPQGPKPLTRHEREKLRRMADEDSDPFTFNTLDDNKLA